MPNDTNGTTTYLYGTDGRQLKSVRVGWLGVHTRSCEIQSPSHLAMSIFIDFHISYKMCRYVNNPFSCQAETSYFFLYFKESRMALGTTQTSFATGTRQFFPGAKRVNHNTDQSCPCSSEVKNDWHQLDGCHPLCSEQSINIR